MSPRRSRFSAAHDGGVQSPAGQAARDSRSTAASRVPPTTGRMSSARLPQLGSFSTAPDVNDRDTAQEPPQ